MRKILVLGLLLATSCAGGSQPIDAKKVLSSMEGPAVPTIQDTMLESAKNAEKQGDYAAASKIYTQMLEKSPNNKDLLFALGESYRRAGDNDKALSIYDMLIKQEPTMAAAKESKGLVLLAKGDFDTPSTLFEEVLQAEPKRWKSLNAMGILFTTRNLQAEAQQYFQAALEQSPSNPSVMNNLGLSLALNNRASEAIETLGQASALTTNSSFDRKRIDMNLSLVYAINGQLDKAEDIAEQYFSGYALKNNMGLYAHLANDDQLAKDYLNMALTENKVFYERAWDNLQSISNKKKPKASTLTAPIVEEPAPTIALGNTATQVEAPPAQPAPVVLEEVPPSPAE